jgi:hypothetical protein
MANSYLKPDEITAEAQRVLHNSLPFTKNIDKQHDKETEFGGQKRGSTLRIRLPNQYTVRETWTINAQDQNEQSVSLVIGQIRGVDMNFSAADLALEINEFSKRFIQPAVKTLASKVDRYNIGEAYKATYQSVGTPGTTPNTALVWLQGGQKLNEAVCPEDDRIAVINSAAQASTVDALKTLFHANSQIEKQYLKGKMGTALGFDWYHSQNVPVHTCGSRTGTILVDDAAGTNLVEGTTTMHVDALGGATDTFTEGDIVTFADVYAVNPETKESTGALKQFVVTAAATAASNEVDISLSPAMYSTGALQNVDALPVDGAGVTVLGTASTAYPQNLVFHPEAYTFATANLEMPTDVSFKAQVAVDGINMRILRQYDINNANYPCRIDIFFGFLAQRPELGCRVWG